MRKTDDTKFDRIDQMWIDLKNDFFKHKNQYLMAVIAVLVLSIIFTSWVVQLLGCLLGKQDSIYIVNLFTAFASNWFTLALTLFIFGILLRLVYRIRQLTEKDYIQDYEENYKVSIYGVYGDAHWQTKDEREECFIRKKNINEMIGDILGIDEDGYLYSLRPDLLGINQNKIAFGSAGAGKSAAIVLNDIFQTFRRGESIIVTDSKGDLYRETAYVARKNGYVVRVLNLKAKELKNSDSWEPLKYVTEEDEIQAEVLAKAIIQNTQDGTMDYWADNEMNCLKATILLVATTTAYEGNRSMREVVNIVSSPSSFDSKFMGLPKENPAKNAYDIFASCKDDVKKQILNGMAIRLALLNNKYVKEIVSHDEIDLILPMKQKCIYYIIISDTDTTMKFVASMFFTQAFMLQCDYSDSLTKEQKKNQLRVRYELDEFKNIGAIPFFDIKISTFRSRKIEATIILQGITQLMELYPNGAHEVILANTTTKILLKAGDLVTAQYFSDLCGQLTTKVEQGKYIKGRSQLLDLHDAEMTGDGFGKRELLMVDKATKLNANILVICILGFQPVKLNKYICELKHPMYKEVKEMSPNRHKPKWRKEKELEEERLQEEFKKAEEKSVNSNMKIQPEVESKAKTPKPIFEPIKLDISGNPNIPDMAKIPDDIPEDAFVKEPNPVQIKKSLNADSPIKQKKKDYTMPVSRLTKDMGKNRGESLIGDLLK